MQFLLGFILCASFGARATDDKSMRSLFSKYDQVMVLKDEALIEEVFSKKFLKESGGKTGFAQKVRSLPTVDQKFKIPERSLSWKKGQDNKFFLAKRGHAASAQKAVAKDSHAPEFIVVEEDGKLKIDGTLSDGE